MIAAGALALAAVLAWPSVRPRVRAEPGSGGVIAELWHDGGGFAHPHWRLSPTLAAVRALPAEVEVYTNAPSAVYLVTGRLTLLAIPSEISASTRLPNPEYADLMARISQGLRERRGVVAWCKNYGKTRDYYPTERQVSRRLGLMVRERFPDGAIYDAAGDAVGNAPE